MSHGKPSAAALDRAFATIVRAAAEGRRCPVRGTSGLTGEIVGILAREGRVIVYIYARNYRVVKILTGEHAGKTTAPDPRGGEPWQVIGTTTTVHGEIVDHGRVAREQAKLRRVRADLATANRGQRAPSAPRPLTQSELDE